MADGREGRMKYDAVIIGSGETGAQAAKTLTERGLSVLILDASGPVPPALISKPLMSKRINRQPIQRRSAHFTPYTAPLYTDDVDNPYETGPGTEFTWLRSRLRGGRMNLWGRAALRM